MCLWVSRLVMTDVAELLSIVFSGLSVLVIEDAEDAGEVICVRAGTRSGAVACSGCGTETSRVHGYHERTAADVPVDGRRVLVKVRVRRMGCPALDGTVQTFREQVSGVLERYRRRISRLTAQVSAATRAAATSWSATSTRAAWTATARTCHPAGQPVSCFTRPDRLTGGQAGPLARIEAACPEMTALTALIRSFAAMLAPAREDKARPQSWITSAREADLPRLHSFTRGLDLDLQAAAAALTLPYHNGRTEGVNTRTKMIKRQMYGRAGFTLLRHRILLS
jgi:transposase